MIGMMNVGAESNVEFYSSARQSSLYDARKMSRDSRTYTADGRVFVNGVPTSTETPQIMWQDIIQKVMTKKIITEEIEEKPTGITAVLRRLSSKLLNKSSSEEKAEKVMAQPPLRDQPDEEEEEDLRHVTLIRINSADPRREHKVNYEAVNDGILRRLLSEQAAMEKRELQTDSGRASLDDTDTNSEVVVQRF